MRRRGLIGLAAVGAGLIAGCGGSGGGTTTRGALDVVPAGAPAPLTAASPTTRSPKSAAPAGDVEAAASSPLPSGVRPTRLAASPRSVRVPKTNASDGPAISPGAPSDAEVAAELKQMEAVQKQAKRAASLRPTAPLALTPKGNAETPSNAPAAIAAIIAGANQIARFPYVYGGGHGSFVDSAYDCSGSVSYALAAAGLLSAPLTSGDLSRWGAPGPGKWITIYANAGHVFMYVAGTRYDTSGRGGVRASRWQTAPRSVAGFKVRHPPGF